MFVAHLANIKVPPPILSTSKQYTINSVQDFGPPEVFENFGSPLFSTHAKLENFLLFKYGMNNICPKRKWHTFGDI